MPHCVRNGTVVCWAWSHEDVVKANVETGPAVPQTVRDAMREGISDKNTFTWTGGGIQITTCGQLVRTRSKSVSPVITCIECLAVTGETGEAE